MRRSAKEFTVDILKQAQRIERKRRQHMQTGTKTGRGDCKKPFVVCALLLLLLLLLFAATTIMITHTHTRAHSELYIAMSCVRVEMEPMLKGLPQA